MPKVTLIKDGKETVCNAQEGQNLLEIGLENGLDVLHACGGNGYCSTCLCELKEGTDALEEITDEELAMGVEPESAHRLSCMAKVKGDCVVEFEN